MLLSTKDIEILKLLCWCKNMPAVAGCVFDNLYTQNDILGLKLYGFISISRDNRIVRPLQQSYDFLKDIGFHAIPSAKTQTNPKLLSRRNTAAEILYTFYLAGASVCHTELPPTISHPIYIASFAAREQDRGNPFGSTRFHGIFCTPQEAFLVFYVDDLGLFYNKELSLFHNFIQATGLEKTHIIFMGNSTLEIASTVLADKVKKQQTFKTDSFSDIFKTTTLPVHFIPLGHAGAQVLAFMINAKYRELTAKAVLASHYRPPYAGLSDTDTIHPKGSNYSEHIGGQRAKQAARPGVIALDMDVNRIDRAVASAASAGFDKIVLYALKEQLPFLKSRYALTGKAEIYGINTEHIKKTIGYNISLYEPPPTAYVTEEGRCFHVSDIAAYRKAGKQNRTQAGEVSEPQ